MKKLLIIICALFCLYANAQDKIAGCYFRMTEPIISDTLSVSNDTIKVSIEYDNMAYFAKVSIENLTDEMIEIDWDKFLMLGSKDSKEIIFDDTVMLLANNPKGTSLIAPHTKIRKSIIPKENAQHSRKLFEKKYAKIRPTKIGYLIPVVKNGDTKYFKCMTEAYVK